MKRKFTGAAAAAIVMGIIAAPHAAAAATVPSVSIYGFSNRTVVSTSTMSVRVPANTNENVHLWLNGKYQHGTYSRGWEHYALRLSSGKNVISAQVVGKHDGLKSRVEHKYATFATPPYSVYDFHGKKQGSFNKWTSARSTVASYPLGVVKDASGKVVYTQVGYAAYQDPAHLIGIYPSWTTASQKAGSEGYVVNKTHHIDKQPSNYYYLDNGQWVSSTYGVEGSQTPPTSDVRPGIRYLPVSVSQGNPPYNTEYYPIENGTTGDGSYIGSGTTSFVWENSYRTVNLTLPAGTTASVKNMDSFLTAQYPSSSLYGLAYSFIDAEKFGSNAVYLFSHAIEESHWGNSSIAQKKNNLYGYGAYNSYPALDAGTFPSDDYAIHFESWYVRRDFLTKGQRYYTTGPTLDGMSQGGYSTDPNWASATAGVMNNYADKYGYTSSSNPTPISPIADPNGPQNSGEPVYLANDFRAKVPTFPGVLTAAPTVANDNVKTLQAALNASGYGPVNVDGYFGATTVAAVKQYQGAMGLPKTGVVDQATWDDLFPAIPGLTSVSEIYMDYTNGLTVAKVLTNTNQRVYEPFIHFTNVYRVEPAGGVNGPQARITVYSSDSTSSSLLQDSYGQIYLHAGDYVSNDNGGMADPNGMVQVHFTQWRNGSPVPFTGYVSAAAIQMPKDAAGNHTMPTYNGLDPANE